MNFQEQLDAFMKASRQKEIDSSDRLQLWEIILKLEAVKNKKLPLVFDIPNTKPMWMWSWRGIYSELAIYTEELWSIQTWEMKKESWWEHPLYKELWKENPTVEEWLEIMKQCIWWTFSWYKWWDFTMNKNTPVSVCKADNDSWFSYSDDKYLNTFITNVIEVEDEWIVVFITWKEEY